MSHSVYGYLKRRTTEELECTLRQYLTGEDLEWNREVILMILDILWERDKDVPWKLTPETIERATEILRKRYGEEAVGQIKMVQVREDAADRTR